MIIFSLQFTFTFFLDLQYLLSVPPETFNDDIRKTYYNLKGVVLRNAFKLNLVNRIFFAS